MNNIEELNKNLLEEGKRVVMVPIDLIDPNPYQMREAKNEEHIKQLADSIKQDGLQQLILVREVNGRYQSAYGHYRVKACKYLGEEKIKSVVKPLTDKEMSRLCLKENMIRENVPFIEEGIALFNHFKLCGVNYPPSEIAKILTTAIRAIERGRDSSAFQTDIFKLAKTMSLKLDAQKNRFEAISNSERILEAEIAKEPKNRMDGDILKTLSNLKNEDIAWRTYRKLVKDTIKSKEKPTKQRAHKHFIGEIKKMFETIEGLKDMVDSRTREIKKIQLLIKENRNIGIQKDREGAYNQEIENLKVVRESVEDEIKEIERRFNGCLKLGPVIDADTMTPELIEFEPVEEPEVDERQREITTKIFMNEDSHETLLKDIHYLYCPECGELARNSLVWKCCNLTIEEAHKIAEENYVENRLKRGEST